MKNPKVILCYFIAARVLSGCSEKSKWELSWSDEFEYTGASDEASWDYEIGFIRNKELQYYTSSLPVKFEIDYVRYYTEPE